jgi:hypothetical protein
MKLRPEANTCALCFKVENGLEAKIAREEVSPVIVSPFLSLPLRKSGKKALLP